MLALKFHYGPFHKILGSLHFDWTFSRRPSLGSLAVEVKRSWQLDSRVEHGSLAEEGHTSCSCGDVCDHEAIRHVFNIFLLGIYIIMTSVRVE